MGITREVRSSLDELRRQRGEEIPTAMCRCLFLRSDCLCSSVSWASQMRSDVRRRRSAARPQRPPRCRSGMQDGSPEASTRTGIESFEAG